MFSSVSTEELSRQLTELLRDLDPAARESRLVIETISRLLDAGVTPVELAVRLLDIDLALLDFDPDAKDLSSVVEFIRRKRRRQSNWERVLDPLARQIMFLHAQGRPRRDIQMWLSERLPRVPSLNTIGRFVAARKAD